MGRPAPPAASKVRTQLTTLTLLGISACQPTPLMAEPEAPSATPVATPGFEVTPKPDAPEPVVVTLVVDQFAAWLAHDRLDTLPADGGFARLLREGTLATQHFVHAVTDTAPGHATLFTGAPPRENGIFANQYLDEAGRKPGILFDTETKLVTSAGVETAPSSSARRLRVETIADRLRAAKPEAIIVSISAKDRAAILGGGSAPTATLWLSDGKLASSTAFTRELPSWARSAWASLDPERQRTWQPLDPTWLSQHATRSDSAPGEGALEGLTSTFPHDPKAAREPELAFRVSPGGDRVVVDLALAALRALPFETAGGLLALSLSSSDYVGHIYGPDSWEWWDNFRRLDGELARLFRGLDEKLGADGYAVVLSADHGTGVLPETHGEPGARPWCNTSVGDPFERPCVAGGRLDISALPEELEAAARNTVGQKGWILGASSPYVYLTRRALELGPRELDRLLHALEKKLEAKPGVQAVFTHRELPESCPPPSNESLDALVCRSLAPGSGQLYLVTKPGWLLESGYVHGLGCNHGSPWSYDRAVPLLVRAPGRVARGRKTTARLSFSTFAHTVSALLDISPPSTAYEATSLTEAH